MNLLKSALAAILPAMKWTSMCEITLSAIVAGLLYTGCLDLAAAQQFPTVPDHTVIGRIGTGTGSGPSQAIPFTTLVTNIGGLRTKLSKGTTNFYANSASNGCGGSGCVDTNDGLTTTTAKKTVLGALYGILNGYDFSCDVANQSTALINMLANEINAGESIHFGPHDFPGACSGGSVTIDGGGFTLQYDSASNGPISAFFGPAFQLQNIFLANSLGPCVAEFEHASIRFGANVVFGNCGTAIQAQSEAVATFLNNFTIATTGTVSTFVTAEENSQIIFGAGITGSVTGTPTYSIAMFVADTGVVNMNSIGWSGNVPSGSKYAVVNRGAIINGAASIPAAGAGTTASGGIVDGAALAVTAGGTGLIVGTVGGIPYWPTTTSLAVHPNCQFNSSDGIGCFSSTSGSPISQTVNKTVDGLAAQIELLKSRNGAQITTGDYLGFISWWGFANSAYQQSATVAVQSEGTITGSNIPTKFLIVTSNASGQGNQSLAFNSAAHLDAVLQSNATTLTAGCNGAGSSLDPGSTDLAGGIVGQTSAATTCTITFGTAYTSASQHCVVSGETSPITSYSQTLSTLVVNFASTANYKWKWICMGT